MMETKQIYVAFHISRSACFSCPACQYGGQPVATGQHGGFFVKLKEAEDHVRKDHGVSEDVHGSINLPEERQSLTPFKCNLCKSPFVLCPSEQQLKKHMKSAHSDWHASTARKHSKRVCRFCLKLLEQENVCSVSECKLLVKSFANAQEESNGQKESNAQEESNGQEQSNAWSFNLFNGTLLVIVAILVALFREIFTTFQ